MALIFVYGSLKKGFHNHRLMEGAKFINTDIIRGQLYSLGTFPGLKEGIGEVSGEIYDCPPEMVATLDRLEGHPDWYRRTQVETRFGFSVETYFYLEDVDERDRVESGIWKL